MTASEQRAERCETCRFWQDKSANEETRDCIGLSGECHRMPPTAVVLNEPCKEWMFANWVLTHKNDWCGEHQPARTTLPMVDNDLLNQSIWSLPFGNHENSQIGRICRILIRNGIATIYLLINRTPAELRKIRGFGQGSLDIFREALAALGLKLKGD